MVNKARRLDAMNRGNEAQNVFASVVSRFGKVRIAEFASTLTRRASYCSSSFARAREDFLGSSRSSRASRRVQSADEAFDQPRETLIDAERDAEAAERFERRESVDGAAQPAGFACNDARRSSP